MIHVDRPREPPPSVVWTAAAELRYHVLIAHQEGERDAMKRALERASVLSQKLKPALVELFHGKCAFCESRAVDAHTGDIARFRPKGGAVGLDGNRSPDHYAWLTMDWENLYLSCANCNRTRGGRFPVRGERAPWGADWPLLHKERALLLDPCRDHPQRHLVFTAEGMVAAVPFDDLEASESQRFGMPTRAQVTIDTFGLNRTSLVEQRRDHARMLTTLLALTFPNPFHRLPAVADIAEQLLGPDEPYLGMKLQVIEQWGRAHVVPDKPFAPARGRTRGGPRPPPPPPVASGDTATRRRAVAEQDDRERQFAGASVEAAADADAYHARAAYLERVEIEGVTLFRDLRFETQPAATGAGTAAPWLMLLGENGSGKTSILRAVALALAGPRALEVLQQDPRGERLAELFEEGGAVRVFLTSQREPLEVRRRNGRLGAKGDASGAKVFVRAYGPSRWFPQRGSTAPEDDPFVRIASLFNPFVPLDPGEESLTTALAAGKSDDVVGTLERLLQLPEGGIVRPQAGGSLALRLGDGEPTPWRALSAGYEAVVAMAAELAGMLYARWGSLLDAEGVCLLDEIDAHLHPRWKMRIVDGLRKAFPRVQFLASTHEPLCLRGLRAGEILVLRRDGATVTAQRPQDDIAAMRVDQLLTSRLFGLHSTLDPALEGDLDRYYTLLAHHDAELSEEERDELAVLRSTVGSRGILGSSRRDQLIYRVIDELVAREPAMESAEERAAQERFTAEQVADAWSRIPDLPEEEGET